LSGNILPELFAKQDRLVYFCRIKEKNAYIKLVRTKQFIIEKVAPVFNKKEDA
jgi:hypothetical protein